LFSNGAVSLPGTRAGVCARTLGKIISLLIFGCLCLPERDFFLTLTHQLHGALFFFIDMDATFCYNSKK
jgi:hypothetical protein